MALLPDAQIAALLKELPVDEALAGPILAEALFRHWLYDSAENSNPVFQNRDYCRSFLESIEKENRHSDKPILDFDASENYLIQQHLVHRWNAFAHCDGIIPVVSPSKQEAIALPFQLHFNINRPPIADHRGAILSQWTSEIESISRQLSENLSVELSCSTGTFLENLNGGSLGLAVVAAYFKKRALVPDYLPMDLLATGIIEGGSLRLTGGLDAKKKLAERMGAAFFHPEETDTPSQAAIGDDIETIGTKLNDFVLDTGIAINPTPRKALDRIKKLKDQIHEQKCHGNSLDFCYAKRVAGQLEVIFLNNPEHFFSGEGLSFCRHLQAQLLNHQGKPAEALTMIRSLGVSPFSSLSDADAVVSLTDQGNLDEAIDFGTKSIEKAKSNTPGNANDKARLLMHLHGALGQAMRTKVVQNRLLAESAEAAESLTHLKESLVLARDVLVEPSNICRGQSQMLLWYALIDPLHAEPVYQETMKTLHAYPMATYMVSEYFALRTRWLAAYRTYLLNGTVPEDFTSWELPDCQTNKDFFWIYATSQKYRGTLLAAQGKIEEALTAFKKAAPLIHSDQGNLLQFIGATVAMQAYISLGDTTSISRAREIFREAHQELGGESWHAWCDSLLGGMQPANPNPQLSFSY